MSTRSKERQRNVRSGFYARWVASLLLVLGSSAQAAELSNSEKRALLDLAGSHPVAATALLFLDRAAAADSSGTLYLEGIASRQALEVLLDPGDSGESDGTEPVLPRSPYSAAPFFVEVRWTISRGGENARLVQMQAQIVNSEGEPLRPAHVLEAPVVIVIASDTLEVMLACPDVFEDT